MVLLSKLCSPPPFSLTEKIIEGLPCQTSKILFFQLPLVVLVALEDVAITGQLRESTEVNLVDAQSFILTHPARSNLILVVYQVVCPIISTC